MTSTLLVEHVSDQCIEVLYGDTEADSTYWKGFQSEPVEAGFVSGEGRADSDWLYRVAKG